MVGKKRGKPRHKNTYKLRNQGYYNQDYEDTDRRYNSSVEGKDSL